MRIVKASDGKSVLSISRDEWVKIGRTTRWASADEDGEGEGAKKPKGKGRTPEAIAEKHGVPLEAIEKELEEGKRIEKEHTDLLDLVKGFAEEHGLKMPISDDEFFEMIALAHNEEIPDYYAKLVKHVEPKGN